MGENRQGRQLPLSIILVVRNEAETVRRCLESVKWADEIIVVDQSSTDATVAVCREYTDKVFVHPARGTACADREFAATQASHEWVFGIDADEVMTDVLRDEIRHLLASGPRFSSYYVSRHNYLLGKLIRGSGWYPNDIIRLFRKDGVIHHSRVHTVIEPTSPSGHLEHPLFHYTYDTLEEYIDEVNRFSTVLARQAYARGKRFGPLAFCSAFLFLPAAYAVQKFIIKRGYRDGFRGVLIAWFTMATVVLTHAKIWELQGSRGGRPLASRFVDWSP